MELTVSSLKSALQAAEEKNASLLSAAQAPDSSLNGSNVHEAQIEALKAELSFLSSSKTSLEIELKVAKSTIASHTARLLEMAENQAKAEDVLQRYEQLCEDLEESRERAEAAELSLYEATKALELLQGDLSAQAKSMIESQEAYEELREKVRERKRAREMCVEESTMYFHDT